MSRDTEGVLYEFNPFTGGLREEGRKDVNDVIAAPSIRRILWVLINNDGSLSYKDLALMSSPTISTHSITPVSTLAVILSRFRNESPAGFLIPKLGPKGGNVELRTDLIAVSAIKSADSWVDRGEYIADTRKLQEPLWNRIIHDPINMLMSDPSDNKRWLRLTPMYNGLLQILYHSGPKSISTNEAQEQLEYLRGVRLTRLAMAQLKHRIVESCAGKAIVIRGAEMKIDPTVIALVDKRRLSPEQRNLPYVPADLWSLRILDQARDPDLCLRA